VHPEQYEFGAADLARVVDRLGPSVASRTADGRPALDIPEAVRAALGRAGVTDCDDVGVCTAASTDHFSHRRDGTTGRQALVVVLEP
jgi:copper oxidase (laccase) domain-containing protein